MYTRRVSLCLAFAVLVCGGLAWQTSRASERATPEPTDSGRLSARLGPPPSQPMSTTSEFGFRGVDQRTTLVPPDPHIAVGPAHVVMITNDDIAFFTKAGKRTFKSPIGKTPSGFLGPTRVFDPEVHWDPYARRFVAFANERDSGINRGNSFFNVAISDDADPNGRWHKYRFNVTARASLGQGAGDIDSPNLGIGPNALYMSADFQWLGGPRMLIYVVEKAPLLSGKQPKIQNHVLVKGQRFWGLPRVSGRPPAMFMLQHFDGQPATKIRLHAILDPLKKPRIVSTDLTVPAYRPSGGMRGRGSRVRIATHGSRFWSLVWRNGSLWACHHIDDPVRSRWYEIRTGTWPLAGKPTLRQSGTVQLGAGVMTAFNAINVDDDGNALMVFSVGGNDTPLGIGRAWRLASDKLGTMRPTRIVLSSSSAYNAFRWGDYGAVALDPVEPNTMWYAHEIATGTWRWSTWIGKKVLAPLAIEPRTVDASRPIDAMLRLDNPRHARQPYLILGSLSGTKPGFKLGRVHVALQPDPFLTLGANAVNSAAFEAFAGFLDKSGCAEARLRLPAIPALRGVKMHFAFVQFDGRSWSYASPPAALAFR